MIHDLRAVHPLVADEGHRRKVELFRRLGNNSGEGAEDKDEKYDAPHEFYSIAEDHFKGQGVRARCQSAKSAKSARVPGCSGCKICIDSAAQGAKALIPMTDVCGFLVANARAVTSAHKYQDLVAWQLSMELSELVSSVVQTGAIAKDFRLRDQIRSAAQSHLETARRQGLLSDEQFAQVMPLARRTMAITTRLLKSKLPMLRKRRGAGHRTR